jgi:hypothetical protein
MKKLLAMKRNSGRSDNNGLLATKTPSFWDLGQPPVGGYFAETFKKIYVEFRQFKKVFGKKTGVSFKNLIMPDMIPTIRHNLKLSEKRWKKIEDNELVKKLKARLGFKQRDAYIAELEACPRLKAGVRDMSELNVKFQTLASSMLAICARAKTNGVELKSSSCKHVFSEAIKDCYRINQWFRLKPFSSIGSSVRHINSKLQVRLASAAEQKHENSMDEARARSNGVRSQVGDGKSESSDAPDRRRGQKGKGSPGKPRAGGIDKDKDKAERDKNAQKMDALYRIENALAKGRFWHMKTPFCSGDNCTMKYCQGCGTHQIEGKPWHDRPRCNCRKHPEFVETGYFHEKFPNRLSIHARPNSTANDSGSRDNNPSNNRTKFAAKSNSVTENADKLESQ